MSETSHFEGLDPFIIGSNEDPTRRHRQYDLYAPTGYLEFAACLARQEIDEVLNDDSPFTLLRLGTPVISPEKIPTDQLPADFNPETTQLIKNAGVVVCQETGPKLVHVTRDDLFLGSTPIRPAGDAFYLHGCTDEGLIEYSESKDREGARLAIDAAAKEREALKTEAAKDIAGHVVEDLCQQIVRRKNDTSWLINNNELFPVAIPEEWQRQIGFEPFGRTIRECIPEDAIDTGLNVIQHQGVRKRLAWIDDLFIQAIKLIKAYLAEHFDWLLGDLPQRQRLAIQHGLGAEDIPVVGLSYTTPPVRENGVLNIYYLPYVTVLSPNSFHEALDQFRKDKDRRIEKFFQTKDPHARVVDIFQV